MNKWFLITTAVVFVVILYGCGDETTGENIIVPEGNIIWVVNQLNDTVVALDDEGNDYFSISGFKRVEGIDCYTKDGSIWLIDFYGNYAAKYSISGNEVFRTQTDGEAALLYHPSGLDINQTNGGVWIADREDNRVVRLGVNGATIAVISGFSYPRSVSVIPENGDCWVANEVAGNVVLIDDTASGSGHYTDFALAVSGGIGNPWDIAAAPNGDVWVCDKNGGTLYRVDNSGATLAALTGFSCLEAAVVDVTSESVYAVDSSAGKVIAFGLGTAVSETYETAAMLTIEGLSAPRNLWVDENSGYLYIAETGGDNVKVFSPSGELAATITGLADPSDIAYWVQP